MKVSFLYFLFYYLIKINGIFDHPASKIKGANTPNRGTLVLLLN